MDFGGRTIEMDVVGLGIVFHSPRAAAHIAEGEDYLAENYSDDRGVQKHIQAGSIVGFGAG